MDDIDAVRDDLQSTKQMLALELRNKEALDRDNKRLQVKLLMSKFFYHSIKNMQSLLSKTCPISKCTFGINFVNFL